LQFESGSDKEVLMDDSEKTYGYSEDIYHGTHRDAEKSYEYGAESSGDSEGSELSPEESAMHIEGPHGEEITPDAETPEYDFGREGGTGASVDSFTWDLSADPDKDEKERAERDDRPEVVKPETPPERGGTPAP
jgi:hypothetical protein